MHNQRQRSDGLDTFCFLFQESLPDRAKFEVKIDLSLLEGVFMQKREFLFNIYCWFEWIQAVN